jgi:formyltetrahydrofolate-dependent phosphoribosylglycinamide formyltransferase
VVFNQLLKYLQAICHVFVSSFCCLLFFGASKPNHKFLTHFCRMFEKLKHRWKVNGLNLVLIITTFALGGSLCGYAGRKLLLLTGLDKGVFWFTLYIVLVTLLWPLCVLLISIPLGQFAFFKNYLIKVWSKISGSKKKIEHPLRVAIFASGAGSNAGQIIKAAASPAPPRNEGVGSMAKAGLAVYEAALIVCNKPGAGVLQIATKAGVPALIIEKERFFSGDHYLPELQKHRIDFIVLAGFLWKMPEALIHAFPKKIVNIHPALLPKYGGKGMYGNKVHEAVIAAGENESGITIHFVDELYDHGEIIYQATCPVDKNETPDTLAQKIHVLEHASYPGVIASVIEKQNRS